MTLQDVEDDPVDLIHAHLDCCRRCRENPMNLCPIGAKTLVRACADLAVQFLKGRRVPR